MFSNTVGRLPRVGELAREKKLVSEQDLRRLLVRQAMENGHRMLGEMMVEEGLLEVEQLKQLLRQQENLIPRNCLGKMMGEAGLVRSQDLEACVRKQGLHPHRKIGEIMVTEGLVTPDQVARVLSRQGQREPSLLERAVLGARALATTLHDEIYSPMLSLPEQKYNQVLTWLCASLMLLATVVVASAPGDLEHATGPRERDELVYSRVMKAGPYAIVLGKLGPLVTHPLKNAGNLFWIKTREGFEFLCYDDRAPGDRQEEVLRRMRRTASPWLVEVRGRLERWTGGAGVVMTQAAPSSILRVESWRLLSSAAVDRQDDIIPHRTNRWYLDRAKRW